MSTTAVNYTGVNIVTVTSTTTGKAGEKQTTQTTKSTPTRGNAFDSVYYNEDKDELVVCEKKRPIPVDYRLETFKFFVRQCIANVALMVHKTEIHTKSLDDRVCNDALALAKKTSRNDSTKNVTATKKVVDPTSVRVMCVNVNVKNSDKSRKNVTIMMRQPKPENFSTVDAAGNRKAWAMGDLKSDILFSWIQTIQKIAKHGSNSLSLLDSRVFELMSLYCNDLTYFSGLYVLGADVRGNINEVSKRVAAIIVSRLLKEHTALKKKIPEMYQILEDLGFTVPTEIKSLVAWMDESSDAVADGQQTPSTGHSPRGSRSNSTTQSKRSSKKNKEQKGLAFDEE